MALFNHVPHQGGDICAAKALYFMDAGGRGNVYLGHIVADHIYACENQAAAFQFGTDGGADIALAFCQIGLFRLAAHMHVGARLALSRNPVDGTGEFAIHQDDALVALAHLRQVTLHDHRLAVESGEHLQQ